MTEPVGRTSILPGLLLVCVVAIGVRAVAYVQIAEGPWLHLHAWTQSDMHFFDRWARSIAAGDVLTAAEMRPYHGRHREMACKALVLAGANETECDDDRIRAVWDGWVGKGSLWQDPYYAYLLAAVYRGLGDGVVAVTAVQSVLGVGTVVLVYLLTLRLFERRAAVAAGLLCALFGPLIMYETVRLRAAPIAFTAVLACWLLVASLDERPRRLRLLGAGMVSAVFCLLKLSGALTVVGWLAVLVWRLREIPAAVRVRGALAVFLVGLAIGTAPLVVRNLAVGAAPWSSAATGPLNFLNGNAADRIAGSGSAVSTSAVAILMQTPGNGPATMVAAISSHDSVFGWLALLGAKFVSFFGAREIPNNVSYAYFVAHASAVGACAVTFPIVLGLFAAGLPASLRARSGSAFLFVAIGAGIAVCVLFFNLSRFRLPIAVLMMPVAGAGYATLMSALSDRRWPALLTSAAVAVAVAAASHAIAPAASVARIADYGVGNQIAEQMAERAFERGGAAAGLAIVMRQLRTEPARLTSLAADSQGSRVSAGDAALAGTFIRLHVIGAEWAAKVGDAELAAAQAESARALSRLHAPYVGAVLQQRPAQRDVE